MRRLKTERVERTKPVYICVLTRVLTSDRSEEEPKYKLCIIFQRPALDAAEVINTRTANTRSRGKIVG